MNNEFTWSPKLHMHFGKYHRIASHEYDVTLLLSSLGAWRRQSRGSSSIQSSLYFSRGSKRSCEDWSTRLAPLRTELALSDKAYAENKMSKWKTKYKTSATRYTRKSYVEEYLKNPVLGSVPSRLTRRPSHPGAGTWRPRPKERNRKRKKKTDKKHTGTGKENQGTEPGKETRTASQDRQETGHQGHFTFRFGCDGSWVGALCSVLGSAPEGSALDPPPFQSQTELDLQTGGQRRASLEPQMVARPQRWSFERSWTWWNAPWYRRNGQTSQPTRTTLQTNTSTPIKKQFVTNVTACGSKHSTSKVWVYNRSTSKEEHPNQIPWMKCQHPVFHQLNNHPYIEGAILVETHTQPESSGWCTSWLATGYAERASKLASWTETRSLCNGKQTTKSLLMSGNLQNILPQSGWLDSHDKSMVMLSESLTLQRKRSHKIFLVHLVGNLELDQLCVGPLSFHSSDGRHASSRN